MQIAAFTAAWWPAELAWRVPPVCAAPVALTPADGACDCQLPPEPFAGPILPFYRFLERENRIWRRAQAEADVARIYTRAQEAGPGQRLDVMA